MVSCERASQKLSNGVSCFGVAPVFPGEVQNCTSATVLIEFLALLVFAIAVDCETGFHKDYFKFQHKTLHKHRRDTSKGQGLQIFRLCKSLYMTAREVMKRNTGKTPHFQTPHGNLLLLKIFLYVVSPCPSHPIGLFACRI